MVSSDLVGDMLECCVAIGDNFRPYTGTVGGKKFETRRIYTV